MNSSIEVSTRTIPRVVIENVTPEVDSGRFPIKRIVGEYVSVEADIFVDGHQLLGAAVLVRKENEPAWSRAAWCKPAMGTNARRQRPSMMASTALSVAPTT